MDARTRNNVSFVGPADAPVVMLAHGFGCDQNMWRQILAELSREHRVLLFDHVGSGHADPAAWDPARYATLDATGNCPQLSAPQATAAAITSFLAYAA